MALLKVTRGVIRVAEKFFRLAGTPLPTEIDERFQLGFEARAIRPWEEFDEGIIRWMSQGTVGAAVGNFSALQIGFDSTVVGKVPKDALWTIDRIANDNAALAMLFSIGASAAGIISSAPFDFVDTRLGARTGQPPVAGLTGSNAAISGDQIDGLSASRVVETDGYFIGGNPTELQSPQNTFGSDHTLTIWGATINTAMTWRIRGRVIFPR